MNEMVMKIVIAILLGYAVLFYLLGRKTSVSVITDAQPGSPCVKCGDSGFAGIRNR